MLIENDFAFKKIKENLTKKIKNEKLKKLFIMVLDNIKEYHTKQIKPEDLTVWEISFINKILLPLLKHMDMEKFLEEIKDLNKKE